MRVCIVGAGALGLTLGYRLSQRGAQVVVIERDAAPGGLATGFELGGTYVERFYHHLFRTDKTIVSLIHEAGLGQDLLWGRPRTCTLYGGRVHQLDSALSLLRFTPLPLHDRLRMGLVLAVLKFTPDYRWFAGKVAASWLERCMGRTAYRLQWEPLLQAKFGARYRDIALTWFWARVRDRTAALGYLRGGFRRLYETLAARIRAVGGEVRLGQEVLSIRRHPAPSSQHPDGPAPISPESEPSAEQGSFEVVLRPVARPASEAVVDRFDCVFATVAPHVVARVAQDLPGWWRARYAQVESYGAHNVVLSLDRPLLPDVYWLNVNDRGYPFLALVEHTNFVPPADYGGKRVLYLGNYLPMSDPLYGLSDDEVLDRFLPHLRKLNADFRARWVREAYVFKAPFAQPIVTVDYAEHVPPHETPVPGLYYAHMFQVYPHDRGQNYSVELAERVADLVLPPIPQGKDAVPPRGRPG